MKAWHFPVRAAMRRLAGFDRESFLNLAWRPRTRTSTLIVTVCLLIATNGALADQPWREARGMRLAKAEAMFKERCKKAGEKIYRTAENVDGIFLMKLRPEGLNYGDQFRMDDPYGRDLGGEGYIQSFLRGFETRQAQFAPGSPPRFGYDHVEAVDPKDGKRYRYTGSTKEVTRTSSILIGGDGKSFKTKEFVLDKVPAPGPIPRYGVTYDDISTHEEREYWIAGSSLRVVDLQTTEVMAERIGFMMDRGQGENGGGRAPWLHAADDACPTFQRNPLRRVPRGHGASAQQLQTVDFVEKTLMPRLGQPGE